MAVEPAAAEPAALAPLIAVILGPLAETELSRALAASEGDLSTLVASPITITLYLVLLVVAAGVLVTRVRASRRVDV